MDYMAGTIGTVRQYYFANSATATTWNDPSAGQTTRNLNMIQREMDFFFKDDWKVSSSLTLNLGVRWDYYGVPWVANGLSVGLVGGGQSIFGGSTGGFSTWLQNPAFNANNLTTQQFIGPNSPNPGQSAYNKDLNNFGPAVGFAWQLPWFGKGKTTLRGGYQISYIPIASSDPNGGYGAVIGNVPGTIYPESFSGDASWANHGYLDMSTLQQLVPVGNIVTNGQTISNAQKPLQVQAITYPQPSHVGVRSQHQGPVHSKLDVGFDAQCRIQHDGGCPVHRDVQPKADRHVSSEFGQLAKQRAAECIYPSRVPAENLLCWTN